MTTNTTPQMKASARELTVYIALEPWQRIQTWVQLAGDYEVSGLGLVEELRDGLDTTADVKGFLVTEVFLPHQENGRTSTELEPDSVAKLMCELEQTGLDSSKLRFWWHYHPGGIGLIWSHTDDECVEELANGEWFVSTVFDPRMECRTRVDLYAPLRVTLDHVPTRLHSDDSAILHDCRTLYEARVTRRVEVPRFMALPSRGPRNERREVETHELLDAFEQVASGAMSYGEYVSRFGDVDTPGRDEPAGNGGWFEFGDDDYRPFAREGPGERHERARHEEDDNLDPGSTEEGAPCGTGDNRIWSTSRGSRRCP